MEWFWRILGRETGVNKASFERCMGWDAGFFFRLRVLDIRESPGHMGLAALRPSNHFSVLSLSVALEFSWPTRY